MDRETKQASPARRKLIIGTLGVGALTAALFGKALIKGGKAAVRVGTEIVEHSGSPWLAGRAAVRGGRAAVEATTKPGDRDGAGSKVPPKKRTSPAVSP